MLRIGLICIYSEQFERGVQNWRGAIDLNMDPQDIPVHTVSVAEKPFLRMMIIDERLHLPSSIARAYRTLLGPLLRLMPTVTAQESRERLLADRLREWKATFAPHWGSNVCGVCDAAEILRENGPDAITKGFLWRLFDRDVPRGEMTIMLNNHAIYDVTNSERTFETIVTNRTETILEAVNFIRKVEIVLELNGQWPALSLHEYKRGDTSQKRSCDALRPLTDSELTTNFRHSAEDTCVLLPCLGLNGDAHRVRPFLDPNLIKGWIRQCKDSHTACSQQRKATFPVDLILIDTEDVCIVDVSPGTEPPYLALSYTWGGVSQPELTKATRAKRAIKGSLTDLRIPRTILDAMRLAKVIGYRYLWVDALCIVQDDSSIRHRQIAQMYDIYQSADVTLVPADSANCSKAIPGVSLGRQAIQSQMAYNIHNLPLLKLPASIKYSIGGSNWKTRGWTFQEELCSQRLLVMLPYCAVFACASALCREDLGFEVSHSSQDPQDSLEGLTLLSATIKSLESASLERWTALFQGLVKQYIHRSFSRDDDIENAFFGVSRMLEPIIGPSYHGIPENCFSEIIHGCWFWDTSLVRRTPGFPSWSWVGWIYRPEQTEVGINAMAGQSTVLQFYRWEAGIQKLGQPSPHLEAVSDERLSIFKHFIPDEEKVAAKFIALQANTHLPAHLIAFTTSCATLNLRGPFHQTNFTSHMMGEYHVVHPYTRKPLTRIRLRSNFVKRTGKVHLFIVIAYKQQSDSFRLMLVAHPRANPQIVERINVTVQNRLVRADDWVSSRPQKSTLVMA